MITNPGSFRQWLLSGVHRCAARQRRLLRLAQRRYVRRQSRAVRLLLQARWRLPAAIRRIRSGLHSQGLAAIANVSGHELSEARSDPASPGAWYDSSGQENGDKCAWTFNVPLVSILQRNAVEDPGRMVQRGLQQRHWLSRTSVDKEAASTVTEILAPSTRTGLPAEA